MKQKDMCNMFALRVICCSLCALIASAQLAPSTTTAPTAPLATDINGAGVRSSGGVDEAATVRFTNDSVVGRGSSVRRDGSRLEKHNRNCFYINDQDCTDLARDEETLMVFSTLGGGLTAIDPITSAIRWTIADDPPIKAEQQQSVHVPQYLPDPRDGSIYQLGDMGSLKKLPYTIPELVASAPCRSSDGILYSGKKSDTWFIVDPKSGRREKVMGFGGSVDAVKEGGERIGWATSRAIYLGRTQYTVMMFDSLAKDENAKPWNITFYDYSAHSMTPQITKEYEYLHLTTTSNGNIVTLDRNSGKFLWKHDLTSPVVSSFLLGPEGLLSVPFTTVSDEAFDAILEESKGGNVNTIKLFKSLYVGEHRHGLYALPSLVDKHTPRIMTAPPIKLLNGPNAGEGVDAAAAEADAQTVYINKVMHNDPGIVLGHYNMPPDECRRRMELSPPHKPSEDVSHGLVTIADAALDPNGYIIPTTGNARGDVGKDTADIGVQTTPIAELQLADGTLSLLSSSNAFNKTKKIILANSGKVQAFINEWFLDHPSGMLHQVLILLVLVMVAMFWYMSNAMRELKSQSQNSSHNYSGDGPGGKGSGSNPNRAASNVNAQDLIDLGGGLSRVGKISFNANDVLGKGCEGTFVFRGTFEERFVAVKRLLPECFTFADREVELLRESDAHENVVRYFCTEQDRQFRYIAVELCAATLQDYTEGERSRLLSAQINVWAVLRQAAAGLSHLHSLNIVHRDIKPQNVLISLPDTNGVVRVMISDFGLCKKLNFGKTSFSRRSGVTGTDGWIAPEMMRGGRTTTAVDIFSLGCVYYYVLSGGQHAFGDALKRQANILTHEFNLGKIKERDDSTGAEQSKLILAEQLIADMIHRDVQRRPPAGCIGNHPVFWHDQKILAFLQDVSDRVERLQFHVEPLRSLEKNGCTVVLEDWNLHLEPLITEDLRKYRGYMGASVRDLLRALRNKKHHYHELTAETQQILGSIPHEFTSYWLKKFPRLISHAYHAFSICASEPLFSSYYSGVYSFTRPSYFDVNNDELYSQLLRDPKPLLKQTQGGGGSPKPSAPVGGGKSRKGGYNFRKNAASEEPGAGVGGSGVGPSLGVGLQRNLVDVDAAVEEGGGAAMAGKSDAFANFRFRRHAKPSNRGFYSSAAAPTKEKNVTWTLPLNENNK